jgi:hypothetical protein
MRVGHATVWCVLVYRRVYCTNHAGARCAAGGTPRCPSVASRTPCGAHRSRHDQRDADQPPVELLEALAERRLLDLAQGSFGVFAPRRGKRRSLSGDTSAP